MAASTFGMLLISGSFVAYDLITFRQSMTHDLSALAAIIGNQSTAAITYDDKTSATEILGSLAAKQRIVAAGIYRGNELLAQYVAKQAGRNEFVPAHPALAGARFEHDHLILYHPINLAGESIGSIYLRSNLDEMRERMARYAGIIVLFIVASLVVTYLLSSVLQQIISRPIFHMLETARMVSAQKNYAVRAHKGAEDELGQLIDGFNEMLGQIQHRDAALQQANDKLERRVYERTMDLQLEISERKRAEQALQEQFTRISLLNQITQIISDRQDLGSILHVVLRQLEDHLAIDTGSVCLFDSHAETLTVNAMRVRDPLLVPRLNLGEGSPVVIENAVLQRCLAGEVVYLSDTSQKEAPFERALAKAGLSSVVVLPLMAESKLFGLLIVTG